MCLKEVWHQVADLQQAWTYSSTTNGHVTLVVSFFRWKSELTSLYHGGWDGQTSLSDTWDEFNWEIEMSKSWGEDQLHNRPREKEKAGPLVQKLFRISRWQQQTLSWVWSFPVSHLSIWPCPKRLSSERFWYARSVADRHSIFSWSAFLLASPLFWDRLNHSKHQHSKARGTFSPQYFGEQSLCWLKKKEHKDVTAIGVFLPGWPVGEAKP